jgi:hypothetical protein
MHWFSVNRTQFPIGQGGFHSTVVHHFSERFSVVIDCGGGRKEDRARLIKTFVDGPIADHDVLAISHLDKDHIDGIPQLTQLARFKHVFLPHVRQEDYLRWMTIRLAFQAEALEGDSNAKAAVIANTLKIVAALYGGEYGRPVLVTPPREDLPPDLEGVQTNEPSDDGMTIPNTASHMLSTHVRAMLCAGGKAIKFPAETSLTMESLDWQFRFYSREWLTPKEVDAIWSHPAFASLKNALNALVQQAGQGNIDVQAQYVAIALQKKISAMDAKNASAGILGKALDFHGDVSIKHLLGKLYEKLPGLTDYNDASLCVYSGPVRRATPLSRSWFFRVVEAKLDAMAWAQRLHKQAKLSTGWLHTGDANFDDDDKLHKFLNHYDAELPATSVFVLPHHGSERSYGKNLERLTCIAQALAERPLFLAPAQPGGKYDHPHASVKARCRLLGHLHIVESAHSTKVFESIRSV